MIRAINAVLLHTRDVRRLVRFYRDVLGLEIKEATHGGIAHAEAEIGDVHFAIFDEGPAPVPVGPITLSFHVANVFDAHKQVLARGGVFDGEPQAMPFGGVVARMRDPDGNGVYLMTWQDELPRN